LIFVTDWDSNFPIKLEDIDAPLELKKWRIRRVVTIEKIVLVMRAVAAAIPNIADCCWKVISESPKVSRMLATVPEGLRD
jgi:hypothetical protein